MELRCDCCMFRRICDDSIICPKKVKIPFEDKKRYFIQEFRFAGTANLFDRKTGEYVEVSIKSLDEYLDEEL